LDFQAFPSARADAILDTLSSMPLIRVIFKHAPAASNPDALLAHDCVIAADGNLWSPAITTAGSAISQPGDSSKPMRSLPVRSPLVSLLELMGTSGLHDERQPPACRLRPVLCDTAGNWTADYTRLRFRAHRPTE
jgi:hypothetical protein